MAESNPNLDAFNDDEDTGGGSQAYVPFRLRPRAFDDGRPDSFAFLAETGRCVIQAGHAFASLLADIALAEAVAKAEGAFGITVPLWRRLPEG